jgi:S1-C subfamily serine protease
VSFKWSKTSAWLCLTVALFATRPATRAQELSPETIYQRVLPSIITLRVESKSGEKFVGAAFCAFREGVAVTAWHVVHDAARVTANFADGTSFEVEGFLDKDELKDIALIPIASKGRPLASFATNAPPIGARAYVIGAPKGYEFSITDGLVSQVQKVDGFRQYQVSCPFSPGNSGGPILNSRGEVIGIAAWTRNGAQNLNFATPATELLSLRTDSPLKKWKTLSGKRVAAFSSESKKRSSPQDENRETAAQLKQTLQKASGSEVTVTVQKDGHQEKFTFTVPSDFGK